MKSLGNITKNSKWLGVLLLALFFSVGFCQPEDHETSLLGFVFSSFQSGALWKIVNEQCVPHQKYEGRADPCLSVDLSEGDERGFAIKKDKNGTSHYLLIPTKRITGIEDSFLTTGNARNYWADAWGATQYLKQKHPRITRENLGIAVNSLFARTQNQLHLHISCVKEEVITQLKNAAASTQSQWGSLKIYFQGSVFRVRKIESESLDQIDPFLLLARDLEKKGCELMDHSLALVGAVLPDGKEGFYLLDSIVSESNMGRFTGAERLLDENCSLF